LYKHKHEIGVTVGSAFNFIAGAQEIVAGIAMMSAPTGITQVAGAYSFLDGGTRVVTSPFIIYGAWTGDKQMENMPSNLLGTMGYLLDEGHETGGKNQMIGELMGDFGLSRRKLSRLVSQGFKNPRKIKNLIQIGNATWQIIRPYKDAVTLKKEGKL